HDRHEQNQPRPLDAGEAAEREDHASLVFPQDLDRRREDQERQDDDHRKEGRSEQIHCLSPLVSASSLSAAATLSTSPSRPMIRTGFPFARGSGETAFQRSPWTNT